MYILTLRVQGLLKFCVVHFACILHINIIYSKYNMYIFKEGFKKNPTYLSCIAKKLPVVIKKKIVVNTYICMHICICLYIHTSRANIFSLLKKINMDIEMIIQMIHSNVFFQIKCYMHIEIMRRFCES